MPGAYGLVWGGGFSFLFLLRTGCGRQTQHLRDRLLHSLLPCPQMAWGGAGMAEPWQTRRLCCRRDKGFVWVRLCSLPLSLSLSLLLPRLLAVPRSSLPSHGLSPARRHRQIHNACPLFLAAACSPLVRLLHRVILIDCSVYFISESPQRHHVCSLSPSCCCSPFQHPSYRPSNVYLSHSRLL